MGDKKNKENSQIIDLRKRII